MMTETASNPYETDAVPDGSDLWSVDPNTVAEEWTADHDLYSRADLSTVTNAFIRTVGEPAHAESNDTVAEDDHLRVADASAFGEFARDHDIALLEPADSVEPTYGYFFGYTTNANSADDTGVPLLVCLPGPVEAAANWLEEFSAAVSDMPGLGIVRP